MRVKNFSDITPSSTYHRDTVCCTNIADFTRLRAFFACNPVPWELHFET
jgi:hypothetical protein